MFNIESPKQRGSTKIYRDHWYPYYAGFSSKFVSSILSSYNNDIGNILDPWNGSGTTTSVSSMFGYNCVGVDLNPVMTIIAKARNLSSKDVIRAKAIALDSIANYKPCDPTNGSILLKYFDESSIRFFYGILKSVSYASGFSIDEIKAGDIDRPTSAFILCVFLLGRSRTSILKSKNPTWIRTNSLELINIDDKEALLQLSRLASSKIKASVYRYIPEKALTNIITNNSEVLPYRDGYFDLVIGSPPYATRIDYAIQTSVELGIIGFEENDLKSLRRSMMGTTMVNATYIDEVKFPNSVFEILSRIQAHTSKASHSYYYKTFFDYFYKLQKSISETIRVTNDSSSIYIVVQDSHYKDVHIDLPFLVEDMFRNNGLGDLESKGFVDSVTMKNINPSSVRRRGLIKPSEVVIRARR